MARVLEESLATGASLIIAQNLLSSRQVTAKRLEADLVADAKMSFGERLKQARERPGESDRMEPSKPPAPDGLPGSPRFGGKVILKPWKERKDPETGDPAPRVYRAPCRQAE